MRPPEKRRSERPVPALKWLAVWLGFVPFGVSCDASPPAPPRPTELRLSAASAAPEADSSVSPARLPDACPKEMVLVEGNFCPEIEQECREEARALSPTRDRCFEYEPSRCVSEQRVPLRFCIDRYEWPNRAGEKPRTLTQWGEARALCESAGKRLCLEQEWLFACEGESMLPHTYGHQRDPTACVMDRMYVQPNQHLLRWEACMANSDCRRAFERLDQREPAGAFRRCRSPFGAYDMNGNVNEWVEVAGASYPKRAALKGGWWGPVRNRCRPTVRFHKEDDWGYEVGFRCCRDATAAIRKH